MRKTSLIAVVQEAKQLRQRWAKRSRSTGQKLSASSSVRIPAVLQLEKNVMTVSNHLILLQTSAEAVSPVKTRSAIRMVTRHWSVRAWVRIPLVIRFL